MKIITIDKEEVNSLNNEDDFKEMMKKKLKESKDEAI